MYTHNMCVYTYIYIYIYAHTYTYTHIQLDIMLGRPRLLRGSGGTAPLVIIVCYNNT